MQAWQVTQHGEATVAMERREVPTPEPAAGQVLIRVAATPMNFPDVLMSRGVYQIKPELPFISGIETAGTVVACGQGVTGFTAGDRVFGLTDLPDGGFAELALLDAAVTFPVPEGLGDAQAASLFVGYQTSWFALHRRARIQPGETLLVHAAAGGVGSAAVELGKAAGARVVAVVGGPEKAAAAKALGADVVVDRHTEDFVEVVNTLTEGRGADVVYDPVGGDTYTRSTKCIAFEGRIVLVGFAGGEIQSARLNHALIKNYSILGFVWGRYRRTHADLVRECNADLARLVAEGRISPLVGERVPFAEIPAALERLAAGRNIGRLVFVADA
ncbi:NADPH:quinone oxidoreductase family protein [Nocardioides sp. JQ2195]|uniref:NADPH:quinone oxidoreductase family protein n=1 Tax=Nocardioides sp. JQ2195 TaxID=2592334 RepID=UPI00143E8B72|nr:NADPH:quinone oxidoreductase family protein [Nocardioides sp. JQ2195]QIX25533.1 NADPH:quinone oxidoreductase family protein [Nocardioides sp. JQ2195]